MRTYRLLFALFLAFSVSLVAQTSNQDIFTILVAAPTSAKDVQVRYFLSGDPAEQQSSSIAKPDENRIVVKTGVDGKTAKGFRAIIFAPGCQFATIQTDSLAASTRQAPFDCQKLATTTLRGKVDISRFSGKDLQVEALYVCNWAGLFFGVPGLAISPFSLGKARMETDGTFAFELPDFSADPLWANLAHNASLMFLLVDSSNGERLARLAAPNNLSRKGSLKVATGYPAEIQFGVR
ncbi:MAG: hypothetical protein JWN42_275 [Candidatus Angelobacter sp.]|nr:hypothetical protein [Candidatus Angelobacter sp.]